MELNTAPVEFWLVICHLRWVVEDLLRGRRLRAVACVRPHGAAAASVVVSVRWRAGRLRVSTL